MTHATDDNIRDERGILVGAGLEDYGDSPDIPILDELAELARTAGITDVGRFYQRRAKPDNAMYVGKGKVDEVRARVRDEDADVVLFDSDLSPRQVRNLEKEIGCRVMDRSEVIMDIFADHARSPISRLQVELAQLEYTRPRLRRMWTHLQRISGLGGMGSRGPGEKQIETDRRLIDRKLHRLKAQVAEITVRRERQVSTRKGEFTVGLVGYTNSGKSTLMNRLTDAGVYEADKLFATLDTKTSHFDLPNGKRVMLSDTVGFIDRLPHHLIASFHATLEEVRQARLLLHVIDASLPGVVKQVETVYRVLEDELEITDRDEVLVFNKMDAVADQVEYSVLRNRYPDGVEVSAKTGEGIDELLELIQEFDDRSRCTLDLVIPIADGRTLSELARVGDVLETEYEGDVARMRVKLPWEAKAAFEKFVQ